MSDSDEELPSPPPPPPPPTSPTSPAPPQTQWPSPSKYEHEAVSNPLIPVYVLTGVFGAIFIIGPFLVFNKGESRGIIRCCIMLTAFCMWIFWVTVYIAQINPLIGPRIQRECLAWMAHRWGEKPI